MEWNRDDHAGWIDAPFFIGGLKEFDKGRCPFQASSEFELMDSVPDYPGMCHGGPGAVEMKC